MSRTLDQIENLVTVLNVREVDPTNRVISVYAKYDDVTLARMLVSLAATHLDEVTP